MFARNTLKRRKHKVRQSRLLRLSRLAPDHATEIYHSPEISLSDARVPGIVPLRRGAQTRAEPFQVVGDGQVSDEFYVLVAKLAGEPHAEGPPVKQGKFIAIQPIG